MRFLFWRKPRVIQVSAREFELIRKAQAEAAGQTGDELDSDDNMPPTALNMLVAKRSGKGFKNLTFSSNLYETKLIDEINKRFEENEIIEKRKRT
jgi:hypothetical protein